MPSVKLGTGSYPLSPPPSYSTQRDVVGAASRSLPRAFCAALGVCCPLLVKHLKIAPFERDYDALGFGGRVQDALVERGVSRQEIDEAGSVAYALLAEAWAPSEEEVSAAENPTAPPAGG